MTTFRGMGSHRFLALVLVLLAAAVAPAAEKGAVSFNRDIRPIMSDTCFRCHGPDRSSRMVELRLDLREEALKPRPGGAIPIVPGDPDKSLIVQRVFEANPSRVMPPGYSHKVLTPAQKDLIRRWVAEGANYEGHWAYQPVKRPPVPAVASLPAPVRNPIDAFIRARLSREGLRPSPEAGRGTLLRRVTLDLTGLPPTPAELQAFLKSSASDEYEKVVDRLLNSPRFAEKQAMHWLDAVRYADTCGFHGDNIFPIWPYRDYVLKSFRENKPFDEFTREQLAGDLLPNATVEQKVASAYNRLNRTSAEGGVQPKEYLAKYGADRVRTASAVWLGSTLGCAECHDHRFDPFKSKDFYSMKAFFADIKETGLVPDKGPKAWGTQISLPGAEQSRRLEELTHRIGEVRRKLDEKAESAAERQADREKDLLARYEAGELAWHYQLPVSAASANGAKLTVYNDKPEGERPGDGMIVAGGPNPDNETYIVTLKPGAGTWTALGIDVEDDESLPGTEVARGADRLVLTEVEAECSAGAGRPARKLSFALATSGLSSPVTGLPAMAAIDGDPKTGWGTSTYQNAGGLFLALRFAREERTEADSVITVRLRHDSEFRRASMGRFRLALSSGTYAWPRWGKPRANARDKGAVYSRGLSDQVLKVLKTPEQKRTCTQEELLSSYFEWASPELQALVAEKEEIEAERSILVAAIPKVVVTEADTPVETRVLPRGNWMDDSGEIVEPAIPAFLGKLDTAGRLASRLDLANWIVSPSNPLTARVVVNRMWRQFFGTGLSRVLEDLGSQGEWPAHPELLDWLAAEFMQPSENAAGAHAWNVKHLIRTIVTSHTYRQASLSNPQLDERDPDNRLLARQSRIRVDAEAVRDIALAASGLLVEKFGGPSVKPYQPDGYLAALNFPKREYSASRGEDLYRRGIYTVWQRTFLHPSLATFDAPSREECTVNRVNSNTPLQALVLLNDPIYVEAARVFAQNILKDGGRSLSSRLEWAFLRTLSRRPTAQERRILLGLHKHSLARFQSDSGAATEFIHAGESPLSEKSDPAELAAMATVARAILNLHEAITRN